MYELRNSAYGKYYKHLDTKKGYYISIDIGQYNEMQLKL